MDDFSIHDTILYPLTYDDLVLMARNINPVSDRTLRGELEELLKSKVEDCLYLFDEHEDEIYEAAFPDNTLKQDESYPPKIVEKLAQDIYNLLLEHGIWQDVCIYYNGKRMSTSDGKEFRYNGEPFIEEGLDPRDYFEYVRNPHVLSMSFEGPVYEILNGYHGASIESEFSKLLERYGLYYELGDAWNLTCCPG